MKPHRLVPYALLMIAALAFFSPAAQAPERQPALVQLGCPGDVPALLRLGLDID